MDHKGTNPASGPGHELRDISPRPVVVIAVGLILIVVIALALMKGLFDFFARTEEPPDFPPSSLADQRPTTPPEPRLQTQPLEFYQRFAVEQTHRLHSYGWVNRQEGRVHIPIDRAMELLVERGIPSRSPLPEKESP